MLSPALTIAILLAQGVPPQAQGPGAAFLQRLVDAGAVLTTTAGADADADAVTVEARRTVTPAAGDGTLDAPGAEVTLRGAYRVRGGELTILRALPRTVTASTELPPSGEGDHLALRAADDRPDTAWCEGAPGAGGDQWLRLEFDEPLPLTGLTILPGDARSRARFEERARPRRIRVFAPPRAPVTIELQDRPEPQRIPLARGGDVREITVRVIRVWRGTDQADMCISELFADGK